MVSRVVSSLASRARLHLNARNRLPRQTLRQPRTVTRTGDGPPTQAAAHDRDERQQPANMAMSAEERAEIRRVDAEDARR
jgi:hypothetical protein